MGRSRVQSEQGQRDGKARGSERQGQGQTESQGAPAGSGEGQAQEGEAPRRGRGGREGGSPGKAQAGTAAPGRSPPQGPQEVLRQVPPQRTAPRPAQGPDATLGLR